MTDPGQPSPGESLRIALLGAGRMGRSVAEAAEARGHRVVLVAGGDGAGFSGLHVRRLTDRAPLEEAGAEVAIDFSVADAVAGHTRHCAAASVDLVVGTTGWEEARDTVENTAREAGIGFLHAPNFSLGVNLFFRIVREACRIMDAAGRKGDFDASLFEAHHRHKVDHPSGTARRIAELVVEELRSKEGWTVALPDSEAVDPALLQVAVTRSGEIPGTHALAFEGLHDRIELRHEARSRDGFARGSVIGAEWIHGRSGVFSMEDLLDA